MGVGEHPASSLPPDPAPRRRLPWPPLAPRLIRPTGESYTSRQWRSPTWSSVPWRKPVRRSSPPAARSHEQAPPMAMQAPAPATTLALVPRAVHPRGRALTRKPPRDRHRMNGRRPGSLELVGAPMPMRVHRSACSVRERKRGTTNEWWRGGLDREDGAVLDR
jgi:hypothetical protein